MVVPEPPREKFWGRTQGQNLQLLIYDLLGGSTDHRFSILSNQAYFNLCLI